MFFIFLVQKCFNRNYLVGVGIYDWLVGDVEFIFG